MHESTLPVFASLGPNIAAMTCRIDGRPVAAINTAARKNPVMRTQAAWALLGSGMDAGAVLGALDGVRR